MLDAANQAMLVVGHGHLGMDLGIIGRLGALVMRRVEGLFVQHPFNDVEVGDARFVGVRAGG